MRAGLCGVLVGALWALSMVLSCNRMICEERPGQIGFGDTEFFRPCQNDVTLLSPKEASLYPQDAHLPPAEGTGALFLNEDQFGEGGMGGGENGGEAEGVVVGPAPSSLANFGSILYTLKTQSKLGQPRQYFHLDVELTEDTNLVTVIPEGDTCQLQGDSLLHCVLDVDGAAYFRVSHRNQGAGELNISVYGRNAVNNKSTKEPSRANNASDPQGKKKTSGNTTRANNASDPQGKKKTSDNTTSDKGAGRETRTLIAHAKLILEQPIPDGVSVQLSRSQMPLGSSGETLWCSERAHSCQEVREFSLNSWIINSQNQVVNPTKSFSYELSLHTEAGSAFLSHEGCRGKETSSLSARAKAFQTVSKAASLCVQASGFKGKLFVSSRNGLVEQVPLFVPAIPYVLFDSSAEGQGGEGGQGPELVEAQILRCPGVPIPEAEVFFLQKKLIPDEIGRVRGDFQSSGLWVKFLEEDLSDGERFLECGGEE